MSWDEGVDSLSFDGILVCDFSLCTFLFYLINEIPEESGGVYFYIAVNDQRE